MSHTREKKQHKYDPRLFGSIALIVFGLATVCGVLGMGNSISEIRTAETTKSTQAILANSGVDESKTISLPVSFYDQRSDNCVDLYDVNVRSQLRARQFEWSSCGYYSKKIETGLTEAKLGEDGLPIAVAGTLTPNRGLNFARWFGSDGSTSEVPGTLQLRYTAEDASFNFAANDFYPLDEATTSQDDPVNKEDGHNHLFTMKTTVPFTVLATGEEMFTISADDDTFVFLNGDLVIDMGGVHRAVVGGIAIGDKGEVYTSVNGEDWEQTDITLEVGELANLQIFHADRDSDDSDFEINFSGMDLAVNSGTQIASNTTDPNDPTYVAPLGESKVFHADSVRSLVLIATIEGVIIVAASVMLTSVARFVIKQKVQKSSEENE